MTTATIPATMTQKASVPPSPGIVDVHPEQAGDHGQRQHRHADDREQPQDVVLAVRDGRLVRRLERLDDLLVVVEQVPDALGGVDEVVEVELEVLAQEPPHVTLEHAERRPLRLDDLPERDDLLLRPRDVADDLLEGALVDVVLDRVELVRDLVEDREAVVEEVVEHVVEQVAGALAEEALAQLLVVDAALEEPCHRQQLDVRQRDQVAGPDEDVELGRVQPLDVLVVERKVEDREEVVRVLVDLRPLALREDVLDVERVPAEALGERGRSLGVRCVEVDPGEAAGGELSRFAARADDLGRGGALAPYPGQAGHRY